MSAARKGARAMITSNPRFTGGKAASRSTALKAAGQRLTNRRILHWLHGIQMRGIVKSDQLEGAVRASQQFRHRAVVKSESTRRVDVAANELGQEKGRGAPVRYDQ